jgi:hypothetical protein
MPSVMPLSDQCGNLSRIQIYSFLGLVANLNFIITSRVSGNKSRDNDTDPILVKD